MTAKRGPVRLDRQPSQRGYVLLVVIAVSVLVITVLATLAKLSLRRGLEAADAERSLQQRWGALTLQRAILPQAPLLFQYQEELASELTPGVPPRSTIRDVLVLGGVTFDLLLGDEDAKLNVNALYHRGGPESTQRAIPDAMGGRWPVVRLRPAVEPMLVFRQRRQNSLVSDPQDDQPETPTAFRSWGEVFDLRALQDQLGSHAALPNLTTGMTCWGSGQLNFRRASDQAILAVAALVVQDGGAQRILTRYRSRPETSLSVLLQSEVSNSQNRDRLHELISETSTNFSLWVDASAPASGSIRYFTVMQRDEEGVTQQMTFMH